VNYRVTAARLLTLLCLVALLGMQAVGGFYAYFCDCGGQRTWTRVDHCHGPHSIDCHHHESNTPHQHDGDSGDRHEHERIIQELQLRSVESLQVPAAIPVLLSWMPDAFEWRDASVTASDFLVEPESSPPPGVTVARTVVFII
jgi:hypothetical protein